MDSLIPPDKKKLKQKIADLKMERRVGKYNAPEGPYMGQGIFKAPADEQKAFRKGLTARIRAIRKGISLEPTPEQSVAAAPGY